MNANEFQQLIEAARVRRLTSAEEARVRDWLLAHPDAQLAWDEERQLDQMLSALPDVSMSPNFTDRVIAAVERERQAVPVAQRLVQSLAELWQRWLVPPRLAAAAIAVAVIGVSVWQYRAHERRNVAESVKAISPLAAVPGVELLKDFELIRRLEQLPHTGDAEILTALQSVSR